MREILFRGKRVDNGEWIEGFYAHSGEKKYILIDNDIAVGYLAMKEVNPDTIGQYTGLTDKNGTKIFEGDIVKVRLLYSDGERATEITTVVYDENNCCYSPMNWKESCLWCDYSTSIKEIEVIGNIYDNPELLRSGIE